MKGLNKVETFWSVYGLSVVLCHKFSVVHDGMASVYGFSEGLSIRTIRASLMSNMLDAAHDCSLIATVARTRISYVIHPLQFWATISFEHTHS